MTSTSTRFAIASDLPAWCAILAVAIAAVSLVALGVELRRHGRARALLAGSGALALVGLLLAILRPVRVSATESTVGARVIVLADTSRSMALPATEGTTRAAARDRAIGELKAAAKDARITVLGFGDGVPTPIPEGPSAASAPRSDLATAVRALATSHEERPSAIVVVSDGRLDDPGAEATRESLAALKESVGVPIHTVAVSDREPKDASVRRVAAAGAAVAHVPLPLRVEIGCAGGLDCDKLTVTARELREDGAPALLASGVAELKEGRAVVDLTVTLERAGQRIIEVAVTPPPGDTIPDNDRRLVTFNVARERVRMLHVAGRPTNDVRALRQWLKGNASIDLVAFFILRTPSDNPQAQPEELALIPFPVDELFSQHLPSFDAVVLQDFDAQPYGLGKHLPALARYVRAGGGLIMVGGQNSFVAGGYAGTPIAGVLPVELDGSSGATAADPAGFVPEWTSDGREASMLAPLRGVVTDELPSMPGASILGEPHPTSIVLWSHPTRTTRAGKPMPVLAVGDQGDGRSIALAVDGAWQLAFSPLGAKTAGRGYSALWDGLLGWLMRDPRFEPAQLDLGAGCVAGAPSKVRVRATTGARGKRPVAIEVRRLDHVAEPGGATAPVKVAGEMESDTLDLQLPALPAGGYSARLTVGGGLGTRHDFACEAGGDEWADSRPDAARLERLARATGGQSLRADDARSVPVPRATVVSAERHVAPIAPAWVWTLFAAATFGAHWFARRKRGLV